MKRTAGICAVSLLAIALLVFGVVKSLKKNSPELIEQPETGVAENTAQVDYYELNGGVSTETAGTQSDAEVYNTSSGFQEFTQSLSEQISDVSEAVTSVISSSQTAADTTEKEKSGWFGRKNKESTTDSLSTSSTTAAKTSTTTAAQTSSTSAPSQSSTANKAGKYEYSEYGFNPQYIDISEFNDSNYELVLINRDYIIPDGYVPKLAYAITGDTNSKKLDYRVAPHYNEMYQAAAKDGIYLTTVSGYRSYELQKSNFERKIGVYVNQGYNRAAAAQKAATIILPPGTSEHNAGLAMDIISLEQNFDQTKEFRWLKEHAQDYGFILRYPKDESVTKIIYEPWHWRYVGVENAKKIKESGLCLEQYLQLHPAH